MKIRRTTFMTEYVFNFHVRSYTIAFFIDVQSHHINLTVGILNVLLFS